MDALLARLEERVGLTRGDLLGLGVALAGCVLATLVALRVPLLATFEPGGTAVQAGAVAGPGAVAAPGEGEAGTGEGAVPVAGPVVVHVAGAVARPGVVELRSGDRVADALAAAGGPRADALLDGLNLARELVDGEQVVVPSTADAPPPGTTAGTTAGPPGATGPSAVLPDGRLDLNTATAAELEELPGVGPVLAGRIIAHREEHGPFGEPVELREVSGIGEATWANLRDLVGVR